MIVFKSLEIINFLTYGNTPTIFDLNRHKSTLIVGENGVGKSTIDEAIKFALFGKSNRGVTKEKLVNLKNKNNASVKVHFSKFDDEYTVIRTIKPDTLEIYRNNELIPQSSTVKEYQLFLENQILNMNFSVFNQLVSLSKVSYTPFMRLSKPERRKFLENVLDLNVYKYMSENLKLDISANNARLSEYTNSLDKININIANQNNLLDDVNSEIGRTGLYFNKQNDELLDKNIELENSISDLKNAIKLLKSNTSTDNERNALLSQLEALNKEYDLNKSKLDSITSPDLSSEISIKNGLETDITELNNAISSFDKNTTESMKKELQSLIKEQEAELNRITIEAKRNNELLSFFEKNTTCPTCTQDITPEFKSNITTTTNDILAKLRLDYKAVKSKLVTLNKELSSIDTTILNYSENITLLNSKKNELNSIDNKIKSITDNHNKSILLINSELDKLNVKISEVNLKLSNIESQSESNKTNLLNKIDNHNNEIARNKESILKNKLDLEAEQNRLSSKISDINNKLIELNSEYNTINSIIHECNLNKNKYNIASELLKDSGIKSAIIDNYIVTINNLMSKYLSELGLFVKITLDNEFNDTIIRGLNKFSYANLSEGEKLRVDLALVMTWRDISKSRGYMHTNLLLFDETFDSSLDKSGTEAFYQILEILNDVNLFAISHTPEKLIDKVDSVIRIVKNQGFSEIASE